jgi:hypothetical protein
VGRPIRKNLLDFTHDADAPGNKKFKALRQHYGGGDHGRAMEQRFWQLNCLIAKADGCRLDLSRLYVRSSLIEDLDLSGADFDEFIAFLSDPDRCSLLLKKDGAIWTERLQEELALANDAREAERKRKETERERRRQRKEGVVTHLSGGKPTLSRGNPAENSIVTRDTPRTETVVRGTVLSSPVPSLPVQSGGRDAPPSSASPSEPQEKELYTKVDNRIREEITPMWTELREIHRKATGGAELRLTDSEMSELLALFRQHDGPSVVAAYRAHQAKKPGKAFKYFLEDFPEYFAKAPKPAAPPPPRCAYCGADAAPDGKGHTATCNRPGNANGLPPPDAPDDFDDSFPEAT